MLPVFIDTLESRRLLSASFNSGTGVLTVNGSNSADTINLANSGSNTVVTISPEGFNQSFVTANITRIDIFCGDGADTLTTDAAITLNIAVDGEGGKDTLTTGAGDDTLFGGSEDDLLDGRTGGDTFAGDTGIDTLSYLGRTAPINVTLDGAQNDGESGEGDQVLTTIDIIFGGSGNDTFDATGAPANFRGWYGNAGNDTLIGGNGDDRLNGGPGDDSLVGADGDDTFVGGDGNDVFSGGNGTDNVTYYNSIRAIRATLGTATGNGAKGTTESDNLSAGDLEILIGGTGNDSLTGGSGNDALYGGDGADLLIGGAGNDYLVGGSGKDSLRGGDGNDTLRGQTSGDLMSGEAGIDLVSYSERTAGISATLASSGTTTDNGAAGEHDQIDSTVENLEGGAGNDTLVGNNASNFILGRAGADTINSQDGVIDTVDGGDGTDAITSDPSLDIVTNP